MTATLLVVRHATAAGNAQHRFIGQHDVALEEDGRREAGLLAARLERLEVARIVSSDLERAIDTVKPLAVSTGLPIDIDARLREIANGEWTNLLPEEIAGYWPELWAAYLAGEDVRRPGGERWHEVGARVMEAVRELLELPGDTVVCTHGGPALILALWAAGVESTGNIFRKRLAAVDNASITSIGWPGPRLLGFNDIGHLGASPDRGSPYDTIAESASLG
jgi:probable phosphoglycerate mutase